MSEAQDAAFRKLARLKCGALFMEMGTGKTKVALDLMASRARRCSYFLWVCPFSTKTAVEEEREKWHPELRVDIVGVETLSQSDSEFLRVARAMEGRRCFMVVDESLKIKNGLALRTQRVMTLGRKAEWRLILNGTPLSKNVLDLWSQMEFLSPRILGMTFRQFRDTYCEYYVSGRYKGLVRRQRNIEHLVAKIAPYVFDAELDLGLGKRYYGSGYSIDDPEGYAALKEELIRRFSDETDDGFLAMCQTLQRFYCATPSRKDALDRVLGEIGEQAVVFVKFLDSIPEGALRLTGDMPTGSRREAIEAFRRGDERNLWVTYGCGAFGLNLQNARHAVFADHTFDYSQRIQAEARVFRMGQTRDVAYHSLWCDCGLERLIRGCLEKKTRLLGEVKAEIERKGRKEWLRSM